MIPTMNPCRPFYRRLAQAALAVTFCSAGAAQAQLRMPSLNLPQPLGQPGLDNLGRPVDRLLDRAVPDNLGELRLGQVNELLRRHRTVLEADPRGEPVVRREILASSPSPAALQAAASLGFLVLREQRFE